MFDKAVLVQRIQKHAEALNPKSPGAILFGLAVIELCSEGVTRLDMFEMLRKALDIVLTPVTHGHSPSESSHRPNAAVTRDSKLRFKVELNYFQRTGKWYARGEYESEVEWHHELVIEVQEMVQKRRLPGLAAFSTSLLIHVRTDRLAPFLVLSWMHAR